MGLKLYSFQQLHENTQEEIRSINTCVFFLVLKRLVKKKNLWPILYLIRNVDYNFGS